jgi:rSAM/selenodomain-associated transferase 1
MEDGYMQRRVLLFIRAPELGRVKTRLEKKMDAKTVLTLYKHFVEDTMESLTAGGHDIIVFFSPLHKEPAVRAWLGDTIHFQPQTGRNLGERMRNAFSTVFAMGLDQAVLMGSDSPDIDIGIIDEAYAFLENRDVVIGPAEDGGYYLIGFQKKAFDGDVFSGIDWGTEHVYQQTMQHVHDAGLITHVLPVWQDIDTFEDLTAFYHRNKTNELTPLKTMKILGQLNLRGFQ